MVRQWFDKLTMTRDVTLSLPKGCRRAAEGQQQSRTETPAATQSTIPPLAEWEGAANPEPEDLPDHIIIIQLSGERHEDISV